MRDIVLAPAFLEAAVGSLREAGFDVLPTGSSDHYDVQLVPGQAERTIWNPSPPSGPQRGGSCKRESVWSPSEPQQPSVRLAVDQLVDTGVLRPLSDSKRNRAWEATGVLDLLTDLEAGR